jgi:hypothetical protein
MVGVRALPGSPGPAECERGEPVAIALLAWHDMRLMRRVFGDWFFYGGRGPA